VAAGNLKNRKQALIIVCLLFVVGGIGGKLALDAYITPGEGQVMAEEAQTMLYRKVMVERYTEFLVERMWTGWGLTTVPTIKGMEQDGIPFTGFLYAGLMIDAQGHAKTLEFNCRMGDPETQPILMRLKTDLVDVLWAATEPGPHGKLDGIELQWDRRAALGVVLAAPGYPANPRKGDAITGIPAQTDDCVVFHAGTSLQDETLLTSGGRVLCVTALADSVRQAQQKAYQVIKAIQFDGMQYRSDIGFRALKG